LVFPFHPFGFADYTFSYSHSSLDNVIGYIQNQKEHHNKKTFKDEYIDFLTKFAIEFKNDYLFQWIE
jgi:putative transposase